MLGDFLAALWGNLDGNYGELRYINSSVEQEWASSVEAAARIVGDRDRGNTFFGVLPRVRREGTAESTVEPRVLWADLDPKGRGRQETFAPLLKIKPSPSIIVDSGQGYHAYWLLKEPTTKERATAAMQALAERLGSDPSVKDMARVLRVPGTLNHKVDPPVPVRLLVFRPDARYSIEDFPSAHETQDASDWGWGPQRPSYAASEVIAEGGRNQTLTSLAGSMRRRGMDEDAILAALKVHNQRHCKPPLPEKEVETIVRSIGRYEPVSW